MYKFVAIGGSTLSRLSDYYDNMFVVEHPSTFKEFVKYINEGYYVVVNGLTDGGISIDYDEWIHYVNKNNIPILIDCLYESNMMDFHYRDIFKTRKGLLFSNLIGKHPMFDYTINVPWFYLQTLYLLEKFNLTPLKFEDHINSNKKSFMCLNAVNRPSRAFVYDYFRDNKVIPDVFSFTNRGSSAERIEQYPTVLLEDDVENPDDGVQWDNTYNVNWFSKTYFNLVTESSANNDANQGPRPLHSFKKCFFPTEKTFKPMYNCHPFICIADKDYHKNLKNYFDLELYTEIWNYDFDDIEENDVRWKSVLDEAKRVDKLGIDYNLIKEKLLYNQHQFLNKNLHKKMLIDVFKQIDNLYF